VLAQGRFLNFGKPVKGTHDEKGNTYGQQAIAVVSTWACPLEHWQSAAELQEIVGFIDGRTEIPAAP
jgi:hypothetical protein